MEITIEQVLRADKTQKIKKRKKRLFIKDVIIQEERTIWLVAALCVIVVILALPFTLSYNDWDYKDVYYYIATILLNLSYSYIAGFLFYVLSTFLPTINKHFQSCQHVYFTAKTFYDYRALFYENVENQGSGKFVDEFFKNNVVVDGKEKYIKESLYKKIDKLNTKLMSELDRFIIDENFFLDESYKQIIRYALSCIDTFKANVISENGKIFVTDSLVDGYSGSMERLFALFELLIHLFGKYNYFEEYDNGNQKKAPLLSS